MKKEAIERMRVAAISRDNTNRIAALPRGKKHHAWSDKPTRLTLHKRLYRKHGKASAHKCKCGKKATDWALVGRKYSDDIKDYKPMCRLCHVQMDKGYEKVDHKIQVLKRERDSKGRFI